MLAIILGVIAINLGVFFLLCESKLETWLAYLAPTEEGPAVKRRKDQ